MLTAPYATVRYIASHGKRPPNAPRLVILHTNAGGGSSDGEALYRWINAELAAGRTPTQPHHQVDLDGRVWQWLDYDEKGVASVSAEGYCISVETQDYGSRHSPIGEQPWTPTQVESLARVCLTAHRAFGVPLHQATAPDGFGIGWHSMWGDNVTKPNPWTITKGKTCPGAARIAQVPQIIARALEMAKGSPLPPPDPQEDDVSKPWLIQSGPNVWITDDWVTRRGAAPEDLNLWVLLDAVQPIGLNASGVKEAQPVPVTESVLGRILDVSPGAFAATIAAACGGGGSGASAAEIAGATLNAMSHRLAS